MPHPVLDVVLRSCVILEVHGCSLDHELAMARRRVCVFPTVEASWWKYRPDKGATEGRALTGSVGIACAGRTCCRYHHATGLNWPPIVLGSKKAGGTKKRGALPFTMAGDAGDLPWSSVQIVSMYS